MTAQRTLLRPPGPLRPTSGQFARIVAGDTPDRRCYSHARYGIDVISELCIADYPDSTGDAGPHWHISASTYDPPLGRKRRPTNIELEYVTDSFGISTDIDMPDRIRFEEDNHEPGRARHLWCPVDETRRSDCECKIGEAQVVDCDGTEWSLVADAPCPGCQMEHLGHAPCQVHRLDLVDLLRHLAGPRCSS